MNLLSLMRYEYRATIYKNQDDSHIVYFQSVHSNDSSLCDKITKIELETLRDNAKLLYEACNNALSHQETI